MRNHLLPLSTLLFVFGCATAPAPPNRVLPRVDLIVSGGTVVPIVGEHLEGGAVVVHEGAILDIGPADDIEARYSTRERIDARGMAILPGFVNGHTHAPMTLFRGIADDRDLMDWLQNFIFPAEKRNVDAEFVIWGTRLAAAEMIRSGTTTFADMYYFEADIARETRAAGLRAVLGQTLIDFPAPDYATWSDAVEGARRFADEFRDDALIIPALAPHAPYTVSAEHLRMARSLASELGIPILIHVAETASEVSQIQEAHELRPVEYLESLGFLDDDVIVAHGIWLSDEEIEILARRRTGVIHNPESNMMLASGVAPVPALLAAGVEVGLGTDGPAGSNNNLDMIEAMATAARLQKVIRNDPRALTARQVLEMATLGGARALGLDDRVGSIEIGKRADLILVDLQRVSIQPVYSVESAIVYAANGSDVVTTIVDGKILMRDRRLLTIDEDAVLARAKSYRDRILRSLESE